MMVRSEVACVDSCAHGCCPRHRWLAVMPLTQIGPIPCLARVIITRVAPLSPYSPRSRRRPLLWSFCRLSLLFLTQVSYTPSRHMVQQRRHSAGSQTQAACLISVPLPLLLGLRWRASQSLRYARRRSVCVGAYRNRLCSVLRWRISQLLRRSHGPPPVLPSLHLRQDHDARTRSVTSVIIT